MKKPIKPTERQRAYRKLLVPLALLLIGAVLIIESAEAMIILPDLEVIKTASMLTMGYVYTFLKLIAGAVSLFAGILILKK